MNAKSPWQGPRLSLEVAQLPGMSLLWGKLGIHSIPFCTLGLNRPLALAQWLTALAARKTHPESFPDQLDENAQEFRFCWMRVEPRAPEPSPLPPSPLLFPFRMD